jgi:hypothetical protein
MSHDERDAEGRSPLDVEAAFADIVAHWDEDHATPVGSWPVQEDVDTDDAPPAQAEPPAQPAPPEEPMSFSAYDGPAVPLAPTGWSPREELPDTSEPEGYVPPEPPPLPRGDALGWLAWMAVLGGPLFLVFASLWWTDVGRFWILVAVLAFIAGFAAIVARLPDHRSDDGPDDGAVV